MIEILKNDIPSKVKIDHINNNPLDNRRENLRIISNSGNNRNKEKVSKDSKYYGVVFAKKDKKWRCQISIDQVNICIYYDKEEHAAWQYNLLVDEYNLEFAKKNELERPEDFVKWEAREKVGKIQHKGIYLEKNRFAVRVRVDGKEKRFKSYLTLEEAVQVRTAKLKELEEIKNKKILGKPILRNENGFAVIELINKKKEKTSETIVDENIYYNLIKHRWYLNNHGYVIGRGENKKLVLLHRYIMGYNGDDFIDHINNNPLDNRKENLRIITAKQNSQNKSASKNSTSKYVGVSWNTKNKQWIANITINCKLKYLGNFSEEIDAAKARDLATREHYGDFGNYNFK